jgi:hypothetical protein
MKGGWIKCHFLDSIKETSFFVTTLEEDGFSPLEEDGFSRFFRFSHFSPLKTTLEEDADSN